LSLADLGLASHSAGWVVSPDTAKLTEGQYVLTVAWKDSAVGAVSLPGSNELKGKELFFGDSHGPADEIAAAGDERCRPRREAIA
jgi:hypothetical protein